MLEKSDPIIPDWTRERLATEHQQHPMFLSASSLTELAFRAGLNAAGLTRSVADCGGSIVEIADYGPRHYRAAVLRYRDRRTLHSGIEDPLNLCNWRHRMCDLGGERTPVAE